MNGEVEFEGAAAGEITSRGAAPVYIGMSISGAADPETPKGMIDEIRISNVARTQEEIQQTMLGFDLSVQPQSKIAITWGELKSGQ